MTLLLYPKQILFIRNYEFEDGSQSDGKIAIILALDDEKIVLVQALVTSQQKIPDQKINHGCTNSSDYLFSFYCYEQKRIIGISSKGVDFFFDKTTFIYFQSNLSVIPTAKYLDNYGASMKILATLSDQEYDRLIKCLKKSNLAPRKIKRFFER